MLGTVYHFKTKKTFRAYFVFVTECDGKYMDRGATHINVQRIKLPILITINCTRKLVRKDAQSNQNYIFFS